jgi:phosphatidylglycerophosphate synthase
MTGLLATVALLFSLSATVGLDAVAVTLGGATAVATFLLLERGMHVHGLDRLGPANRVTLARAVMVAGIAALVAQATFADVPRTPVILLSVVALTLDCVDGRVARRTRSVTALGAAFDMETDAFLILVLSWYVVPQVGVWVLGIGMARYLLLAAGATLPWLAGATPSRTWAKVVAAVQGIVLTVVAADVLPTWVETSALLVALGLLVESFGRQTVTLWRQRRTEPVTRASWVRPVVDLAAVALLWVLLMVPHRPDLLSAKALLGIPGELVAFIALAMVLPRAWGRLVAVVCGVVLTATVFISVLDLGFYETFDRPFDLLNDPGYAATGLDTLRSSVGRSGQLLVVGVIVVGVLAAMTLCVWAALRVRHSAYGARRVWAPVVTVLALAWSVAGAGGAEVGGVPIAASPAAALISGQVDQVQADIRDRARFEHALAHDPYAGTPGRSLLTRLRGKDVLVVFVESYGRVATDGSWSRPRCSTRSRPTRTGSRRWASHPAAATSARRRSVASAGWRTRPSRAGCGSTPNSATTRCCPRTASR